MTSVGTGTATATSLVGRRGVGLFGSKHPRWYACVVKMDNMDGTLKVQWDDGKKYSKRLPEENFKLTTTHDDKDEDLAMGGEDVPQDIFATVGDGDY